MATKIPMVNQKGQRVIAKWGRDLDLIEKATGEKLTLEKKLATAWALQNASEMIAYTEATNPANIGQYKRYALDIIKATVPNLIAFDLMAVQAMENRVGMINYLNYTYDHQKGQVEEGQIFNSSINGQPSDIWYASDKVDKQELGQSGNNQYGSPTAPLQLRYWPINLSTFTIEADNGNVIGVVDAAGNITGTGITSGTLTVDGKLEVTFAAATTTPPVVSYTYDNESVRGDGPEQAGFGNHPEIGLDIQSIPVTAKARTLRAYWAFDAAFELQKEYGESMEDLLATQATGELAHEIDNELTFDLLRGANAGTTHVWSKDVPMGISLVDHYNSFHATLVKQANVINKATRKVKPNFIICGVGVANIIEMMTKYEGSGGIANGPYKLGTLPGYDIFVNPDYPDNEYVMGYKGSNMFDAGMFYCPYMPVSSTDLIMDANFRGQRGWATMYGKKLVNSQMYIKGVIN